MNTSSALFPLTRLSQFISNLCYFYSLLSLPGECTYRHFKSLRAWGKVVHDAQHLWSSCGLLHRQAEVYSSPPHSTCWDWPWTWILDTIWERCKDESLPPLTTMRASSLVGILVRSIRAEHLTSNSGCDPSGMLIFPSLFSLSLLSGHISRRLKPSLIIFPLFFSPVSSCHMGEVIPWRCRDTPRPRLPKMSSLGVREGKRKVVILCYQEKNVM